MRRPRSRVTAARRAARREGDEPPIKFVNLTDPDLGRASGSPIPGQREILMVQAIRALPVREQVGVIAGIATTLMQDAKATDEQIERRVVKMVPIVDDLWDELIEIHENTFMGLLSYTLALAMRMDRFYDEFVGPDSHDHDEKGNCIRPDNASPYEP
jgi:hypothetical protein